MLVRIFFEYLFFSPTGRKLAGLPPVLEASGVHSPVKTLYKRTPWVKYNPVFITNFHPDYPNLNPYYVERYGNPAEKRVKKYRLVLKQPILYVITRETKTMTEEEALNLLDEGEIDPEFEKIFGNKKL